MIFTLRDSNLLSQFKVRKVQEIWYSSVPCARTTKYTVIIKALLPVPGITHRIIFPQKETCHVNNLL